MQWYKEYWVYGTKFIDYKIGNIGNDSISGKPQISIERLGKMPMPIDILITYKDGSKEWHYIPLNLMFGAKLAEDETPRIIHDEWRWTHPGYTFTNDKKLSEIKSIEIDPSHRMADVNRTNNKLVVPE